MGTSRLLVGGLLIAVLLTLNDAGLVKKILRHRRETLTSPGGDNITLPNPHQPVVFNHVYNIKVPAGSLCSVDLDSPGSTDLEQKDAPDGSRITEHTLDGENQIVFTHRINIPKQACGCADGMPELKNLLSRLEMLEGEVSTLREQCTSGSGCCGAQATGTVGVTPYCSGRGNFSSDICGCICNPGWRGTNCSESDCPDNCSDQGRCVDGKCLCFEGYSGLNCSIEVCRVDCGKYGTCIDGVCVCIEYYGGEDCSESDCLNNCLGRGKCVDGDCVCEEPWTGFDCSELICPNDCYDRGRCNNGTCQCDPGFTGEDCGQQTCPNDCMGRGFCVDGKCVCSAGYTGEDCSSLTCLNDCSDRGHCFNGVCICDTDYQGEDCSQLACLNNCNDRGQCINGKCVCVAGFQGEDCSELSCPNNCRNRGRCVNGQCVCDEGFAGEDCNVKTCPSDCHGRGDCVDGKCVCHAGFTGEDCSELSCPNNCQNRGRCVSGQCVCDEGFTGEDCSLRACPNDCLGRGYCDDGRCVCQEGFAGDDCSALTCPANCNNRGRCVNGMCQCETGFEGDDCGQRSCLNNCHGLGRCMDGQCVCDEGYIGEDCSVVSPAKDLTVTDVNTESVNLTWTNDMLVTEYLVTYVPTAPGGLQMERTVPGDRTAATIEDLEPGIEYLIKVFAVLSNKKSVPVSARVATHLPQPDGLKFKSIRETSVEVQWDQLDFPFDSWELSFRNTKEENGEIFNPLNRGQTSFEQFGLGPGQEYEVSLGVVKNNTKGPKVTQTVVTKLDTPGEMEIRDVSDTYAVIAWSPPVAQVDTVTLTFGPSSDPSDRKSVELSPTDTQHTADGLTPDTEYEVTLVAKRGDMTSDPATNTFTTDLDAPIDLQVVGQTDNTVTLEWTNTRADVDNYRVKFSPVSGTAHGEELFPEGSGDKTTATITGLKPGTEYGIGVTAVKNERESLPATVHAVTDLDPPRDLEVKDSTETTLTLAWKRPRAKISNYRLAYESRTDGRWQEIEVPGDATTYTLTNLTPGTRHTVTLVAERGRKRSEPASTSASTASFTFYLAESGPELAAPTGPDDNIISFLPIDNYDTQVPGQEGPKDQTGTLTVSDVTSDGFNLSWEWKADVLYDSYTVELADASGLWDNREIYLAGDAAGASVRGLNASTEYQVRLYGVLNSQRSSLPFEAVAVITAPKPTSPDVVALRLKFAPTSPQPAPETGVRPTTARTISTTPPSNTTETPGTMVPTTTKAPGTEAVPPEISATPSTKVSGTEAVPSETGVIPTTKVSRTEAMPSETRVTPSTKVSGTEAVPSETRVTPTTKISGTEAVPSETRVTPTTKVSRTEAVPSETRVTPTAGTMAPTKTEAPGTESVPTEQIGTTDGASGDKAGQEGSGLSPLSDLNVTNVTQTSLSLTWSVPEPSEFDGFRITLVPWEQTEQLTQVKLVHSSARSAHIDGLLPGTLYEVSLYGMVEGEQSLPILVLANTTKEELKPQVGNLTVSDVSWDSFNVSWTVEEGEFEGFVIEVANMEGGPEHQNLTLSGDALSLFLSGLSPNSTYMVALYGLHKGLLLGPVYTEATTVNSPVVGNLYVSNVTHKSFSVSWNGTESGFDGFILEVIDTSWQKEPAEFNVSHNTMSRTITGLEPRTDYIAFLYGVKKGRRTHAISTVATTAKPPNLYGLVISNVTSDRLSLSWKTGARVFDNFVVEIRESALPSQAMGRTLPGGARSTELTGLKGNTRYNVKLYASTGGKNTSPINAVAKTEARAKLGRLSVSKITPNNFTLNWKTVAGHFDSFVIRVNDRKMLYDTLELTPPGKTRKLVVSGLVDSTAYDVQMYGLSHGRRTPPVSTRTRTASLPKVENLTVSEITPYGFRLSWGLRDGDKSVGRRFSRLQVEIYDSGRLLEPLEFSLPGNQTSLDIWGLITGIGYEVKLTGLLPSGLRSRPLTAVAVTEAEPEIEHLFVSDITPESFRITWTVDEGLFDRFVIKVRDAKKLTHPQELNVAGDQRTQVFTQLMGGTEYEIELYGVTLEHRSQPVTGVARTGLGAPRGIRFSDITATSSNVHWTVPRADVDSYRVTFLPLQGGNPEIVMTDGTQSDTLLSSLIPGETYQVTVVAIKGLEESDPVTDTFTTGLDMPRSLTAVNITDTEALLLWQPAIATVDGYVITYSSDSVSPVMERVSGNIVEFEMSSLTPNTKYSVSVYATKDPLKSQAATTEFTTEMDAPRDLVASDVQTDSATLTWTPPLATVTGYILNLQTADGHEREVVLDAYENSYTATGLDSSTGYTARLQAIADDKRSSFISTTFTTTGVLYTHPKDCSQALLNGESQSGLYTIYVGGDESQPMQVYCDMETDGGGWIVFLRRQSGKTEFFRNWRNYSNGFGDMMDEFWLGLSNLHKLTSSAQYALRVDLRDGSDSAYAYYDKITISEPRSRYKIQVGTYSGTAGDSMTYHQNRPFSTYDNDNDVAVTNCALSYKGAFWYKNCHRVNLMGRYGDNSHSKGINWFHWKGHEHSVPFAEMKIRPVNFGNLEGRRRRS